MSSINYFKGVSDSQKAKIFQSLCEAESLRLLAFGTHVSTQALLPSSSQGRETFRFTTSSTATLKALLFLLL